MSLAIEKAPTDIEVTADASLKTDLMANLKAEFEKEREGIHVSDLVYCIRKAAFRKLQPKPLTEVQFSYFLAGRGHHETIQFISNAEPEKEIEWNGIKGSIDLLADSVPVEIKTTRSFKRDIPPHYIRQLSYYCAMLEKTEGRLLILYLTPNVNHRNEPEEMIKTYAIKFRDLEKIKKELLESAHQLQAALDEKNVNLAPAVREEDAWQCKSCEYAEECRSKEASR